MLKGLFGIILSAGFLIPSFGDLPATTNYQLNSYGFGSGGTAGSSTSNYSLEGISGEISGQSATTSNYQTKPGFVETQQANVPTVTLSNPSNYYDKLKFVIGQQNNPADALYSLQISTTSDFSSAINYVKNDLTIGTTLTLADYQNYTAWGGASGANIIGLASNTTYYIRAKATQGLYTESAYGPSSNAATVGQSISFCMYTGANCAAAGNSVAFGSLVASTVANSPNNIGVDFATNADFGGNVYIYSLNGGLASSSASYTINSATADLSSAGEGYGAKVTANSQSSGGPFNKLSPYDSSGDNVGILSTTINTIFSSANPITGGVGAVQLKAKPSNTTPEATDYTDTVTLVAAATF
jgi:hypothetical protein